MTEMPDFIRRALEAQGKYPVEEIEERLDDLDPDTLLGVVEPDKDAPAAGVEQETLDLGLGHVGPGEPDA